MTEQALSGVGEALAQARQTRGLALSDVAQQLKFSPRHIEAIESERFDALPGGTFARGMVRSYARLLKLDAGPLLERLEGRFSAPDADQLTARFLQPVPFSDSGRRSTLIYLGLSLVVLGFVGLTAYQWHRESNAPPPLAQGDPAPPAGAPAPVVTAPKPEANARIETVTAPLVAAPTPPPAAKPNDAPKSDAPKSDAPNDAPQSALPQAAVPQADAPKSVASSRIVLRCEEESWIEVKDAADRVLVSSLNAAGSERVVQGRPPFSLIIGNAQHVRMSYNDRPVDLQPHIKVEVARFTLN